MLPQQPDVAGVIFNHQDVHGASSLPADRSVLRQHHNSQPKIFDRFDDGHELLQINRLGHITIGVKVIALEHVLFILRGGQHDDRNAFQFLVSFDFSQDFTAVLLRKFKSEQDQMRDQIRGRAPAGGGMPVLQPRP